jgi:hypothetical protein
MAAFDSTQVHCRHPFPIDSQEGGRGAAKALQVGFPATSRLNQIVCSNCHYHPHDTQFFSLQDGLLAVHATH